MTPRNLLYLILGLALFYAYCQMNDHDELVEALRESTDLVPRINEDDPIAPALADWLRGVHAVLAKADAIQKPAGIKTEEC